ncbi:MAG: DEAD/DEAH box helicase family protein [Acidimicrobiales bacterium]|nr:DEAD/DEAH box helicase family protein [Acidimicrobiales bacterium]
MSRPIRLRRWQKEALDLLERHPDPDFLAVATPGAGKTTFALAAVVRHLHANPQHQVVVVAPTSHLKLQWARAAAQLGIHLEPSWSSAAGELPSDMHGVAVTYQQVAANPDVLRRHARRCIVVLDELHHAGDERAWGDATRHAFDAAPQRLSLSGTPFRSDTHAIPFVRYVQDEAEPDFDYGYQAALTDRRVVRPVYFPTIGGFMEWTAPDGLLNAASFDDALDRTRASQRLRTALSLDGEWLPTVLSQANERLLELRTVQPDAAGLVIAADQDHARGIAELLRARQRVTAMVVTSDDPTASRRIAAFADGDLPWLVAVRMVSEGVDIPRLRLGVFATTTTTELFFRQVVGRFVRHTGGPARRERAWLFIPDEPRLRRYAATIAEQRRHSLRRSWEDGERPEEADEPEALDEVPGEEEQLSLFQVLSAEVVEGAGAASVFDDDPDAEHFDEDDEDTTVPIDLPLPPPRGHERWSDGGGRPLAEVKQELRAANAEMARQLARYTGLSHQEVNGRLNREVSILRISEASAEQLEARVERAEKWLANL